MMNKKLKKKIISGLMVGSVITSLSITAFASETNQEQNNQTRQNASMRKDMKSRCTENKDGQNQMEEQLKKSGIFSDSEIKEIKAYLESKKAEMKKERQNLRGKTEEERKAYFESHKEKRQEMLNGLVTEEIITQAQLDKLKEIMPEPKMNGQHRGHKTGGNRLNKANEKTISNGQNNKSK